MDIYDDHTQYCLALVVHMNTQNVDHDDLFAISNSCFICVIHFLFIKGKPIIATGIIPLMVVVLFILISFQNTSFRNGLQMVLLLHSGSK